jgi:hypothetical protein
MDIGRPGRAVGTLVGHAGARHRATVSVSAFFDGAAITLFDGSRSGSGARLRRSGMGIGYQPAMT